VRPFLAIDLGSWSGGVFTPKSGAVFQSIEISATDDVATIAGKINAANTGVVATLFNDGTSDRLLLRSKETGEASGFRVQVRDDATSTSPPVDANTGLARLAFDPAAAGGPYGMAGNDNTGAAMPVQYAQDAKARINGLAVTSGTNTLTDNIPGVTINLLTTTTTPVSMRISEDVTPAVKNVNDFVTAYNTLSRSLTDLTKYEASTKSAGLFQGDSSVVGLQNILRNMLGSISMGATSQRLSDVGIERQTDGSLKINTAKLSVAANNGTTLQQLFTANNGDAQTNGFAVKFRDLGRGVAATGGFVFNKAEALQKNLTDNTAAQAKVNDRATLFEARLRKQYSALDAQMAQLNALNAYVTQQVAAWNKSTG
jgi:flagellar hook-associated protein 2